MATMLLETARPDRHLAKDRPALPSPAVQMPAVAAILCNYNQRDFLEDAIASMLAQTYPDMEHVVVDDCSTDGSAEAIADILARLGAERRVRFIRHEENRGQLAAMLTGLDATTAPFVAWLDADDVWLPQFLERHIAHHLNGQVNAAISTSNMAIIDAGGTLVAGADPSMSTTSPLRKPDRTFPIRPARLLQHGRSIDLAPADPVEPVFINRRYESWVWSPTSGMVFRRTAIDTIRPSHSEGIRTSADHYLARFSHVVGGTLWMSETLGCYRIHGRNGFAKWAVRGDGPVGQQPRHITEEGNYQFALKLADPETRSLMPKRDLERLLLQIARGSRAIGRILASKGLRRTLRPRHRLRLLARYAAARLPGFSRT